MNRAPEWGHRARSYKSGSVASTWEDCRLIQLHFGRGSNLWLRDHESAFASLFSSHSGKIKGLDRGHHRQRRYLQRLSGEGAGRKHWRVFLVLGALVALGTLSGRNSREALVEHGADEVIGADGEGANLIGEFAIKSGLRSMKPSTSTIAPRRSNHRRS
ncbi:hypothetical protein VNO77_27191 [Canavalia gladiata]|uniref:Uncharacterized protein n=1 Tax=Canavalia gladiata TaxID=3824 RepID=A0AAN9Q689_CANGL